MSDLSLTLVQTHLYWENIEQNLAHFSNLLAGVQTDVVVLPEMFSTGFTMQTVKLAEKMDGRTMEWMARQAAKVNGVITGSIVIEEKGSYYNRLIWMYPDGQYLNYDKRHLFRMGEEQKNYICGTKKLIATYKGWRFCPLICYDLRFPVWSRNTAEMPYDCLIYVANWPAVRRFPWIQLLRARAIENLAYVVGVNRIGLDANGFEHSGDSCLLDFKGETVWTKENVEEVIRLTINKDELNGFREKFPAYLDADGFEMGI